MSVECEVERHSGTEVLARQRAVAILASKQHGVVARRQLEDLGVTAGAIRRQRENGRLHRVHRGVYVVGHPAVTPRGRWMAAVLAAGSEALLSHRSAAALWGLIDIPGGPVDVIGAGKGSSGVRVHRSDCIGDEDRVVRDGIPVTGPTRTLVDLAAVANVRKLTYAFEAAERQQVLDVEKVEALCGRRRGTKALRVLIADQIGPDPVRSRVERRFLTACRQAGLPKPAVNVAIGDSTVDFLWPKAGLVVELDSFGFHRSRRQFEEDRRRDLELRLQGLQVVRVTDRQLDRSRGRVMRSLAELLSRQGRPRR